MINMKLTMGDETKGPGTQAQAMRNMLSQHMLAMRGATGPQGMTGLPGSLVRSNTHLKAITKLDFSKIFM